MNKIKSPKSVEAEQEYVHQPFEWLNVDKWRANDAKFFIDLGLVDCCTAIVIPLEDAINALLEERPEMPSMTPSQLPKIDKDVLNNPGELRKLISGVELLNMLESSEEELVAYRGKVMKGVFDLDVIKTAHKMKADPEFNIFESCSYRIDGIDIQSLLVLVWFDKFFSTLKREGSIRSALAEFGMIYYAWAQLKTMQSGLISEKLVNHVLNIKRVVACLNGGDATSEKAKRGQEHVKLIALEILQLTEFERKKRRKLTESQREKYIGEPQAPWANVNFATETTLDKLNMLLKDNPIPGSKPKTNVSFNYYESIVKTIKQEHPKLFLP